MDLGTSAPAPSVTSSPGSLARALARLERTFSGQLVRRESEGYEQHRRVWNGSIDRRPALIARCVQASDVVAALRFARESEAPIAVRSGGHSFPGFSVCDDGVVIDLRSMNRIAIDADARLVRAQAGVLLGELDRATQAIGMAVPLGAVSHTGVAGLTLGGGIGWLMRKHGLTVDQLMSVEVVTADGRSVTASESVNSDLFWGVRGGGGNFGIVTEFTFHLNPVGPTVLAGLLLWPLERGHDVMRFYRDWCRDAPDDLTTAFVLRRAPAVDLVPRELHGRAVVGVVACWSGPLDVGEDAIEPMRRFGPPVLDLVGPRPFVELQSMLDPSFPHGLWAYVRSCNVAELSDAVIDVSLDHAARLVSPRSTVTIWQLGGAVARVARGATAFGDRSSPHTFNITGATDSADGFDQERAWVRAHWAGLTAAHTAGVYANFLMEEGEDRIRQAHGQDSYARLKVIKRAYDPDNVFRRNQNIDPA